MTVIKATPKFMQLAKKFVTIQHNAEIRWTFSFGGRLDEKLMRKRSVHAST